MQVTTLEIVLAVVAVFIIFGPKRLPKLGGRERAIKVEPMRVPIRPTDHVPQAAPHTFAAGRAPSPLQQRAAGFDFQSRERKPQFAYGEQDASPLPHEMLRV
jgi:hypothetical protein